MERWHSGLGQTEEPREDAPAPLISRSNRRQDHGGPGPGLGFCSRPRSTFICIYIKKEEEENKHN